MQECCYVCGGINGGKTKAFLTLIGQLKDNIEIDLQNGVIALWHDESHLNRYILGRNDVKMLSPAYAYPQDWNLPFECKILIRDKRYFGGHAFLRGVGDNEASPKTLRTRLKGFFRKLLKNKN